MIQTYAPDHFAITAAAEQDYGQFYRQEFLYRKMMGYPPAAGLLSIQLSSRKEEAAGRRHGGSPEMDPAGILL